MHSDEIEFFKENEIEDDEFDYIISRLNYRYYKPNTSVITYGELGDKFYIILSGTLAVLVPDKTYVQNHEEDDDSDDSEFSAEESPESKKYKASSNNFR